jgi:hypothetical protein
LNYFVDYCWAVVAAEVLCYFLINFFTCCLAIGNRGRADSKRIRTSGKIVQLNLKGLIMWLSLLVSEWSKRRTTKREICGPSRIQGELSGDKGFGRISQYTSVGHHILYDALYIVM